MKLNLPAVVQKYIESSNDSDLLRFISCFSQSALVYDERHHHTGHQEIELWFKQTRSKYQFKSEPIDVRESDGQLIMRAKVTGTFPGSPATLSYSFKITNDLIQELQIS